DLHAIFEDNNISTKMSNDALVGFRLHMICPSRAQPIASRWVLARQ
ncbi:31240_t:CDS:1, partial [Gigaspora margarita]